MSNVLLFDVEGTTTAIDFVHKTLFPYAYHALEEFTLYHQTHPDVINVLAETQEMVCREQNIRLSLYETIAQLKFWITVDRKAPPLKTIQGLIWDDGYKKGAFKGHVYPEVAECFAKWKKQGHKLAIYSSGSVHAQKCIFGYSSAGDLTPLISNYFDTKMGHKREVQSYLKIAEALKTVPQEITFFSDIAQELIAAKAAGMNVVQVFRQGGKGDFRSITSFLEY